MNEATQPDPQHEDAPTGTATPVAVAGSSEAIRFSDVVSGDFDVQADLDEAAPPKATSLLAITLPSKGGDTQFVDVRRAYDELPESIRQRLSGLRSLHVHQSDRSPRAFAQLSQEALAEIPRSLQPLVIKHPESDRAALYLNTGRMQGIEGMRDQEAFELIDALYAHATQPSYEYRHTWQVGDLVIWDNRSVMHQANADYDPNERRYLYRLMVKGVPLKPLTL